LIYEPAYEVKVDDNKILIKKQCKSKSSSPQIELAPLEKDKVEGTDVTSFKFSKQNDHNDNQERGEDQKALFNYTAGQFAFFDIGGVYNDPKGPIRHFTISSSPTENFIMFKISVIQFYEDIFAIGFYSTCYKHVMIGIFF
jgi:glycine betaine catabolism B